MSQITFNNISIGYSEKELIKDISLDIESGDYICIVGDNGSGKSSLIKCLLNLNKPLNGSIIFSDVSKKDIGYLPQSNESSKNFPTSVNEVVFSGFSKSNFLSFISSKVV